MGKQGYCEALVLHVSTMRDLQRSTHEQVMRRYVEAYYYCWEWIHSLSLDLEVPMKGMHAGNERISAGRQLVNPLEVDHYYDVIKHPMDLSTMRIKLKQGIYETVEQFESGVSLMCQNAMTLSDTDTIYYKEAQFEMRELASKIFKSLGTHPGGCNLDVIFKSKRRAAVDQNDNPDVPEPHAYPCPWYYFSWHACFNTLAGTERDYQKSKSSFGRRLIIRSSFLKAMGKQGFCQALVLHVSTMRDLQRSTHEQVMRRYVEAYYYCWELIRTLSLDLGVPINVTKGSLQSVSLSTLWRSLNEKMVDHYYDVIKHPMDLSTMRIKLKQGLYETVEQFQSDVSLMCQNAMTFNDTDTIYYKEVDHYYDVIKHPMDLSTMRIKQKKELYETVEQFESDVSLMCQNAMTFNDTDTIYYKEVINGGSCIESLRRFTKDSGPLVKEIAERRIPEIEMKEQLPLRAAENRTQEQDQAVKERSEDEKQSGKQ
ncbi:hypothetical protein H6P81_014753 [Aristolochia fimbriata]|uniref:Bromo domain-containing protein n=1 Tax=Aristolochia fimbriata TaxID=158543 RepID=A0AAV7E4A8_ARIFI|nr:hypothetical protein H6P81_014753 [Aristolochia fimbriata]